MDKSKYLLSPIGHYSMTNHPSIFDEESLTALELVGRLTAKMVEFCKQYNDMVGDLLDTEGKHDQQIVEMWEKINNDMIVVAREAVEELIASGVFSEELVNGFNDLTTKDKAKCWAFNNLEEMRNMPFISDGDTVLTKGYYANGDGGGAVYHIRKAKDTDTDNGGSVILFRDLAADLVVNDRVYIKQFGAVGDNTTDDTAAIVAAAEYAAKKKVVLCSDEASYLTGETCVIKNVYNIDFPGKFPYLEIRHAPSNADNKTVKVNQVTTLILRNYKRSTFVLGFIDNLRIIADTADEAGAAFAYNYITGGTVKNLAFESTGSGWINENVFEQLTLTSVIIDGEYPHNNNRFYDVTMEGKNAVIEFRRANSNYFTVRGEGGPAIVTSENSINNIVKKTWCSTDSAFMYNYTHEYSGGVLKTHEMYDELACFELAHFDMWNIPFTNGVNANNGRVKLGSWQYYGTVSLPANNEQLIIECIGKAMRPSLQFFDANGNAIPGEEYLIHISDLKFSEGSVSWAPQTNLDKITYAIKPTAGTDVAYYELTLRNGNTTVETWGASIQCYAARKPVCVVRTPQKPRTSSRPTQTENVPLGFEVMNTAAGSNVYGWRFNGTEWVDIYYSTEPKAAEV